MVLQVQAVLKRKEEEDQQMRQVVQTLQLALEKEKTKVNDLKEQVGALGTQCTLFSFKCLNVCLNIYFDSNFPGTRCTVRSCLRNIQVVTCIHSKSSSFSGALCSFGFFRIVLMSRDLSGGNSKG